MVTPLHDVTGLGFLQTRLDLMSEMNHSPLGESRLTFTPSTGPICGSGWAWPRLWKHSDYSAWSTSWPGREQRLSFLDRLGEQEQKTRAFGSAWVWILSSIMEQTQTRVAQP